MSGNGNETIIELSIDETNKLRAELGLAPLRITNSNPRVQDDRNYYNNNDVRSNTTDTDRTGGGGGDGRPNNNNKSDEKVIDLSIDETNALRQQLGLPPLRVGGSSSSNKKEPIHVPAENDAEKKLAFERIENAKLKRQVEQGIATRFAGNTLSDDQTSSTSWAQQMLQKQKQQKANKKKVTIEENVDTTRSTTEKIAATDYTESDLMGLNVAHNVNELYDGTTVLTLADAPILKTTDDISKKVVGVNDDDDQIENIQLREQKQIARGLYEKRKLELGLGRAGGYAGFDDDEFEELGGIQAPIVSSSRLHGSKQDSSTNDKVQQRKKTGFTIGDILQEQENQLESDLFAATSGKAISLEPSQADLAASDFMTAEELEEQERAAEEEAARCEMEKKKFKKHKKDKKKKSNKHKRRVADEIENGDNNSDNDAQTVINVLFDKKNKNKKSLLAIKQESDDETAANIILSSTKGLLEELEETAVEETTTSRRKRRRRRSDSDEDAVKTDQQFNPNVMSDLIKSEPNAKEEPVDAMDVEGTKIKVEEGNDNDEAIIKRAKYDEVVAKANERAKLAFKKDDENTKLKKKSLLDFDDDEPDDAFLNAALAKARRLNRLKEISSSSKSRGAEAVVDAVQKIKSEQQSEQLPIATSGGGGGGGTITFSIDETREFMRALQARTEQTERQKRKKIAESKETEITADVDTTKVAAAVKKEDYGDYDDDDDANQNEESFDDMDLEELAKQVKQEEDKAATDNTIYDGDVLDGRSARNVPLGRGLGNMLNLLKSTGEMTRMNAGKEEMHGRAKDKRTYEDYEPLDLKQVVKIDKRTAQSKDLEFANREVKLEYRDKHGRLLTRKEAFRDLCYQFHGYGSGKRKQEKKLKQIEQEQAQKRLASRQAYSSEGAGTFGALQATQKATGKAFVVHKT